MLVLSRKESQRICIGSDIEILIQQIRGRRVRVGISAPPEIAIVREELLDKGRNVTSTTREPT